MIVKFGKQVTRTNYQTWRSGGERDDEFSCRDEQVYECRCPKIKVTSHRTPNASKPNAHHVSYLAKSEVDGKGVHHVSAIMDSGSAECVAPDTIARNIPLMETDTADGGVIKNKGEKTGDRFRARYQITDVSRPLNPISPKQCVVHVDWWLDH